MSMLYDKLIAYSTSDYYGFHMPGHKRNQQLLDVKLPYDIDITEIDGFDNLHHADGIIKQAQMRAATLYHADETHFLVNGSTVGILSAILGCTKKGDTILVARNSHKSVYHAIFLNELNPIYVYPKFLEENQLNGEIEVEAIQALVEEHVEIQAVVITSPTYDGVVSDVARIAEYVHRKGIPLIVDEAHGAHFGFHSYFPENANTKGADIVIHSLHKTLPALTQAALLHMNGHLVDRAIVQNYLQILQTSSPSYVLMASIDTCIEMLETRREEVMNPYVQRLTETRAELRSLQHMQMVETPNYDKSKIVISVKDTTISSKELYDYLLEKDHLQLEMVAGNYVLGMTSVGDTQEGFVRFVQALQRIDHGLQYHVGVTIEQKLPCAEMVCGSAWILGKMRESLVEEDEFRNLPWEECRGYITTEYAYLYPPGIPLMVPGERITEEVIACLTQYRAFGFLIEGLHKEGYIKVWIHG
ncbi:MAG: aminotransferase class I/II-fold pyridoxal phosphate-dependent enzyme [Lachnospiraceae bacterium]